MVLDGDVEQEEGRTRLLVFKFPDDLLKVRLVADIAVFHDLGHVHVVHALELVEAQPGIGLIPLPGGASAGVEGQSLVTPCLEQGGQRGGGAQHILLVGDAARGQEGHGVAGEELKFAGAGARAEHRGVGVAEDGVVQGTDVVGDAFAELQVAVGLKISPGFVHNGDDVGILHRHRRRFQGLHPLQNGVHRLRSVALRLLHLQKLGVAEKDGQTAAGAVGPRLIPHIGLYPQLLQLFRGQQEHEAGQPRRQTGQPQGQPLAAGEPQPGLAPLRVEEHHQGGGQKDGDSHLPGEEQVVVARHAGGGAQGGEVPGQDRGTPEGVDKAVGCAPGPGGNVNADGAGGNAPHQGAQSPEQSGHAQGVGHQNGKGQGKGIGPVCKLHQPHGGNGCEQQKDRLPQPVFAKDCGNVGHVHSLVSRKKEDSVQL